MLMLMMDEKVMVGNCVHILGQPQIADKYIFWNGWVWKAPNLADMMCEQPQSCCGRGADAWAKIPVKIAKNHSMHARL